MMRTVAVALCVGALASAVAAQTSAAPDNAKAYDYAVRCFAVTNIDGDKAASRVAFDAALKLGRLQGLTNAQMNVALDWAISRETWNIRRDPGYKARTLSLCRKLGLAS